MGTNWVGKWEIAGKKAGRYYVTKDGRQVYVIEKQVHGVPYNLTVPRGMDPAEAWRQFTYDPETFRIKVIGLKPTAERAKVYLDDEMVEGWAAWHAKRSKDERYRAHYRNILEAMQAHLKGIDIKTLKSPELVDVLSRLPYSRRHRNNVAKLLFKFLKSEDGGMRVENDPAEALQTLKTRSRKEDGTLREWSMLEIEDIYRSINDMYFMFSTKSETRWKGGEPPRAQDFRDFLCIKAHTAMHNSEIIQMAADPNSLVPVQDMGPIAGFISYDQKTQRFKKGAMKTTLNRQCFNAAKRLIDRKLPVSLWQYRVYHFFQKSPVKGLMLGDIRASVITWALREGKLIEPEGTEGVPAERLAPVVGHHSTDMIHGRYDLRGLKPLLVVPINLRHPDDPPFDGDSESAEAMHH